MISLEKTKIHLIKNLIILNIFKVYLIFEIEKRPKNKITFEEIRKKYKQFALIYHPDRNGGDAEKTEKLKKIKNIYDILEVYYQK